MHTLSSRAATRLSAAILAAAFLLPPSAPWSFAISAAGAQTTNEDDMSGADGEKSIGGPAQSFDSAEVMAQLENIVETVIRPGYAAFAVATKAQMSSLEALCSAPADDTLAEARQTFGALVSAFAGVEFIRFGPIRDENRLERILFFPDPRGVTRRQVEQLLAKEDESALEAGSLAEKSVAVQGLPALEFLLFGEGSDALADGSATYRCTYGRAIAGNLSAMSDQLVDGWASDKGIAGRITNPLPDDPAYRSASDSIGEIVSVFTDGLEIIRDQRLRPALGEAGDPVRPHLFLFQRSDNALRMLAADFAGLKALFEASAFTSLLPENKAYLKNAVTLEFDQIGATLDELQAPLDEAAASEEGRGKLDYVLIAAGSLRSEFENQIAAGLGLTTGFSSLDGD